MSGQTFDQWWAEKEQYITAAVGLLNVPLSEDADAMWGQITEVERYLGYFYLLLARADGFLDEAQHRELELLVRKYGQKGLAAYEKETAVNASVSSVREARDTIRGVIDTIQRRVSLAQSRLAYIKNLPRVEG